MAKKSTASRALREWALRRRESMGVSFSRTASDLDISSTYLYYLFAGVYVPSEPLRKRIEKCTGGAVRAQAWDRP